MSEEKKVIGRVSITGSTPSTDKDFYFWVVPSMLDDVVVQAFDIVEVPQVCREEDGEEFSTTYGLVASSGRMSDAQSHLANFISYNSGENLSREPNSPRQEVTTAKATVLNNDKKIFMPVEGGKPIRFVDEDGFAKALGIDKIDDENRIPVGIREMSDGSSHVVFIDKDFLLGPDGNP